MNPKGVSRLQNLQHPFVCKSPLLWGRGQSVCFFFCTNVNNQMCPDEKSKLVTQKEHLRYDSK